MNFGSVQIVPPPRTTSGGAVVTYIAQSEPCIICQLDAWTQVDETPLHTDRCLNRYQKANAS